MYSFFLFSTLFQVDKMSGTLTLTLRAINTNAEVEKSSQTREIKYFPHLKKRRVMYSADINFDTLEGQDRERALAAMREHSYRMRKKKKPKVSLKVIQTKKLLSKNRQGRGMILCTIIYLSSLLL